MPWGPTTIWPVYVETGPPTDAVFVTVAETVVVAVLDVKDVNVARVYVKAPPS